MKRLLLLLIALLSAGCAKRVGEVLNYEIAVYGKDPELSRWIQRLVATTGTLEFRILANSHDHKELIERARVEDTSKLRHPNGELLAWWVPVAEGKEDSFTRYEEIAIREKAQDGRTRLEVLVVKDVFDVTGKYLVQATRSLDEHGRPCILFTLSQRGGQLFGGLTGENLPDPADGFRRKLGIILNGSVHSAGAVRSPIYQDGQITADFTVDEAQDLVDILNGGVLSVQLRKVERHRETTAR